MSFIQYSQNVQPVALKKVTHELVSLMVPLNADTFLLLLTSNDYQVYRIRSQQILYSGRLPNEFVASRLIEPLENTRNNCVFFSNSEGALCRLDYKEDVVQVRDLVMPVKVDKMNLLALEYRVLDQIGEYLVGWVKNIENMSCTFFVYDWVTGKYSNCLNLGANFFNLTISNLTQSLNLSNQHNGMKLPQVKFALVSSNDRKIWYNYIYFEIRKQQAQIREDNKQKRVEFVLVESGKRSISYDHCPKIAYVLYPYLYVFTNSKDGAFLIEINMEFNSERKAELKIGSKMEKGLIRKYLGIADEKILFTVHNLMAKTQEIYCFPFEKLKTLPASNAKVQLEKLVDIENEIEPFGKDKISNIAKCTQGYSFHRYSFDMQRIAKLALKQNSEFQPILNVETFYRIPKKYYYSQIAQQLHFCSALTHEMLSLL